MRASIAKLRVVKAGLLGPGWLSVQRTPTFVRIS